MSKVVFWIVVVPLAAAIVVFSVNNRADVVLDLWPFDLVTVPLPVFSIVLAGLFLGFLAGWLVAWVSAGKARKRARLEAERAKRAERELTVARDKIHGLEREDEDLKTDIPKLPGAAA